MSNFQFVIEWCNLSSRSSEVLVDAFDEFVIQLQSYRDFPTPEFSRLSSDLVGMLPSYLVSMIPGSVDDGSFSNLQSKYIFVFCDGHEEVVQQFQQQNELAHWGVAVPCKFAIAWVPNKYLLWHELLHLMNAKDCYNKFGINKCPNPKCIMRRAPSRVNCGDCLTLCSKNVKRIRRFAANKAAADELSRK